MKQLFFAIIGIVVLVTACSSSDTGKKTEKGVIIDFKSAIDAKKYSVHKLSDYASSIRYVPLETKDDALIGQVRRHLSYYYDGQFYIVSDDKILKFDSSGKFIRLIGDTGQGPNEYIAIASVDVSPETNHLYILDEGHFLLEYTLDGNFIRKLPLKTDKYEKEYPYDFRVVEQDLYAFGLDTWSDTDYMLSFSDTDYQDILPIRHPKPLIKVGTSFEKTLKRTSEGIQYYNLHYDTVYWVNQNKTLSPAYIFHQGKYQYKRESGNPASGIYLRAYLDTGSYVFTNWVFGNFAPEKFEYIWRGSRTVINSNVYSIYDKREGKLHLLKQPIPTVLGLRNDIDNGPIFWPALISSDGKEAIMFYEAYKLIEDYKQFENPSKELKILVESLNDDDNPVMIIATLK